ncbi:hypothetical protein [Jannaschia ovalis]|uniref:Ribbon-helix-helix domain-containing protein n=1 Tax=Jannaschia ovalis TaxID=3038773 RepID=A0ABY8LEV3_9RHOB|nr:hypothetical protein [Jannaschia sp. GRR-S6-38]WGH78840.1 hypothetical protein P8627_00855 [Jannaschia sp. GRR-S6-38]
MPRPRRLTRRFQAQMSEAGYRRLRRFAEETGLDEGEALSFLFENLESVTHKENLPHRLSLHKAMLEKRAEKGAAD